MDATKRAVAEAVFAALGTHEFNQRIGSAGVFTIQPVSPLEMQIRLRPVSWPTSGAAPRYFLVTVKEQV
jgi:hypothetical protein